MAKWKHLLHFFHVRTKCSHERGNRECRIVCVLCSDYLISDRSSRMVLQNYHHKKPNTTQKDSDLRLSPRGFEVGICATTTDYQLKAIVLPWPKARLRIAQKVKSVGGNQSLTWLSARSDLSLYSLNSLHSSSRLVERLMLRTLPCRHLSLVPPTETNFIFFELTAVAIPPND